MLASIVVLLFIWLASRFGLKLFRIRYMTPSFVVIWPIITAFSFDRLFAFMRRNAAAVEGRAAPFLRALPGMIAIPVILVGLDGWMRPREIDSRLRTARRLPTILSDRPLEFVTLDSDTSAFRNYCGEHAGQVKYLMRDGSEKWFQAVVSNAIRRRFWKDLVIPQREMERRKGQWLIKEEDFAELQKVIGKAVSLSISERLEDDLVVVSLDEPSKP